jgi:alginate O-acetyltransferase complex protein AlgI
MSLTSPLFLFLFLPLVIGAYQIVPTKLKNIFLLTSSLVFYAWNNWYSLPLILGLVIANWLIARRHAQWSTACGIVLNVAVLAMYKYAPSLGELAHVPTAMPLGLSFFTFHSLSYLIESQRSKAKPGSLLTTGLYSLLFPIVTAGPINKYDVMLPQLADRRVTAEAINEGIGRFVTGLAQKVLIANQLGLLADSVFAVLPVHLAMRDAWAGIVLFTLQIYFDFAGYSSMAIGIGKMLGFTFMENFNYPYIATSINDFWQRWHISLTTWLRNYVYFPLGGNRKGVVRTYVNIAAVFVVSGLWHGTGWTFLLWGVWHGFFMIMEKLGADRIKVPKLMQHIYALGIVMVGWVLFRSTSIASAWQYLGRLFAPTGGESLIEWNPYLIGLVVLAVSVAVGAFRNVRLPRLIQGVWYALLLIMSLLVVAGSTYTPFIYARF